MDVKYINPFISASMNVFSTFASIDSQPGLPSVRVRPLLDKEINGFIGLNGHGISGYFIINFSSGFLNQILTTLFDHSEASTEELYDLAGELTNMITGSAKADLSQKGFFFDVAVPKISHSAPQIPAALKKNPVIVVPFETRAGNFHIEASLLPIDTEVNQAAMPAGSDPSDGVTGTDQMEDTITVEEFSRLSKLSSAKIKRFLRTGFLKGVQDQNRTWFIHRDQIAKFNRRA